MPSKGKSSKQTRRRKKEKRAKAAVELVPPKRLTTVRVEGDVVDAHSFEPFEVTNTFIDVETEHHLLVDADSLGYTE